MPPAVSPVQGSRTGIIAGMVASIVIAVVMIVIAVYFSQEASQYQLKYTQLQQKDSKIYTDGDPRIEALTSQQMLDQYPGARTALDVQGTQADLLAKLVGGDMTPDRATQQARTLLNDSSKKINDLNGKQLTTFTLPSNGSLATALSQLTDQYVQMAQAKKAADDQAAAANQSKQQLIQAQQEQLAQKDKQIGEANAKAQAAQADAQRFQQEAQQANAQLSSSLTADQKKLQDQNGDLTKQLAAARTTINNDNKQIAAFKTKLRQSRVNPSEPIVQQADATIIRVPDANTCFINIGAHQSVTKGLTFEVYDKNRGIPALGDGMSEENMPAGKASIEVYAVGPDTSECRVTKLERGQQLVVGDPVSNLVFDPHTHYNFVVYGDFDLTNSGTPSPGDTEIIKRLITQWGGKLQDHVDVNTDFVIMGAQPQIPTGGDTNSPEWQLRVRQAQAKADQFQNVVHEAAQLSIPIMNQNRFLYFIGYYDQARQQ